MKQIEITAQEQSNGRIKILDFKNCLTLGKLKDMYPLYLDNKVYAWNYDIDNEKWIGITAERDGYEIQYKLSIGESYTKKYFNECIRLLKIAGNNLHKSIREKNKPFVVKI